ncbi:MAG: hypothetical protein KatS3mg082_1043 [Nitrospiraceae bacterium]|nr:MAG: hypothetical protein KatS3mg082_1043 [Nitrospiraceae bacterium]
MAPAARPASMPDRMPSAIPDVSVAVTEMYSTMSASISSAWRTVSMALAYCTGVAEAMRSTGFLRAAAGGRNAASAVFVWADSSGTSRPAASQASVQRIAGPPALVMRPTRRPGGSGWAERPAASANNSSSVSARITPVWRKRASTAVSLAASAGGVRTGGPDGPKACVRPSRPRSACAGRRGAQCARTVAGCRTTPGRARSHRSPGLPPNTARGRCPTHPPCCPRSTKVEMPT